MRATNKGKILLGILVVVVLALGYLGISWGIDAHNYITTDNAKVSGDILSASPRISGKIVDIRVKEGDTVKKGELLFTMATDQIGAEVNEAAATLGIAKEQLDKAVGGARSQEITGAEAMVDEAYATFNGSKAGRDSLKTTLSILQNSYDTLLKQMLPFKNPSNGQLDDTYAMKQLNSIYMKKGITDAEYMVQAQEIQQMFSSKLQLEGQISQINGRLRSLDASVEASKAGVSGAESNLTLLKEGVSSKDIDILVNKVRAAQAAYDLAKLSLDFTSVRAPSDGTVVKIADHDGDVINPGHSAMSLINLSKLTATAYILENDLQNIKTGNSVKLYIDAFPGKTFKGTVKEIGEATTSVFNLFGNDNFASSYTKDNQRVPVTIAFDYAGSQVKPGMSVTAKIRISK